LQVSWLITNHELNKIKKAFEMVCAISKAFFYVESGVIPDK
jgi:hypothetical protein